MNLDRCLHGLFLIVVSAAMGMAAELSVVERRDGQLYALEACVSLFSAGEAVSAIQVDLELESAGAEVEITAGPAVEETWKTISLGELPGGGKRVLIAGLNTYALPDTVLFHVKIRIPDGTEASTETVRVRITASAASSPEGQAIGVTAADKSSVARRISGAEGTSRTMRIAFFSKSCEPG